MAKKRKPYNKSTGRNYKRDYEKFGSSEKAKKTGMEKASKNRGRKEKSRVKGSKRKKR
jgi:hypothetical protein